MQRFSPCGNYVGCTIQKFNPLVFSVWGGNDPIAVLESDGFSSLATIKSGNFDKQGMYYVGGDDGNVYGWKIPDVETSGDESTRLSGDLFFMNSDRMELVTPPVIRESVKLQGHGSIVNSVACHPTLPYLFTAGIEKVVRIYAPHAFGDTWREKNVNGDLRTEEDEETLSFFKRLIRRERFGVDDYLWGGRYMSDSLSITDLDGDNSESDSDDSDSDLGESSSSDDGLLMQEYDNDSNLHLS
jgi:DDB1- and CUL4-associated factor 5